MTGIRNQTIEATPKLPNDPVDTRSRSLASQIAEKKRILTTSAVHRAGSKSPVLEMDIEKSTRYLGPSLAHDMPHEARSR